MQGLEQGTERGPRSGALWRDLEQGLEQGSKRKEPAQGEDTMFEPSAAATGALHEKMSRQRKKKTRKD